MNVNIIIVIFVYLLTVFSYVSAESYDITYTPFNNIISSLTGTGNKTLDAEYIKKCKDKCYETLCCSGLNLKCESKEYCLDLQNDINSYVYKIVISVYISVLFVSTIITAIIFYVLSKKYYDTKQSVKNAIYIFMFILGIGIILPILVLLIIAKIKNKSIKELFGAKTEEIYNKSFYSLDTIEDGVSARKVNGINTNNQHRITSQVRDYSSENNSLKIKIESPVSISSRRL